MKQILLILAILSIIILSGCTSQDISEFAKEAIENPQLCGKFDYTNTEFNADICYSFVAQKTLNLDLCENIVDTEAKKSCYYNIKRNIGFTDLSDCENIPEFKSPETCYSSIAKGIVDINECEEFPEAYRYLCYYEFAASTNNVAICDEYFSPLTEDYIEELIEKITEEARAAGKPMDDFQPFSYVDDKHSRCYDFVARRTNQHELCLSPNCVYFIASETKNPNVCFAIETLNFVGSQYYNLENELDGCIAGSATRSNLTNTDFCFMIKNEYMRNGCIMEIADQTQNIKLCKGINEFEETQSNIISFLNRTEESKINNCYTRIAKNNVKKCDDVAEDSMKLRNACYYHMSRINNDPTICKNIVIPEVNDVTCEDYMNSYGLVATEIQLKP